MATIQIEEMVVQHVQQPLTTFAGLVHDVIPDKKGDEYNRLHTSFSNVCVLYIGVNMYTRTVLWCHAIHRQFRVMCRNRRQERTVSWGIRITSNFVNITAFAKEPHIALAKL